MAHGKLKRVYGYEHEQFEMMNLGNGRAIKRLIIFYHPLENKASDRTKL